MEFRVLGPLQVSCDGAEITVPAGKQRALLAALLLRASRVVSTMELVRWIWGMLRRLMLGLPHRRMCVGCVGGWATG